MGCSMRFLPSLRQLKSFAATRAGLVLPGAPAPMPASSGRPARRSPELRQTLKMMKHHLPSVEMSPLRMRSPKSSSMRAMSTPRPVASGQLQGRTGRRRAGAGQQVRLFGHGTAAPPLPGSCAGCSVPVSPMLPPRHRATHPPDPHFPHAQVLLWQAPAWEQEGGWPHRLKVCSPAPPWLSAQVKQHLNQPVSCSMIVHAVGKDTCRRNGGSSSCKAVQGKLQAATSGGEAVAAAPDGHCLLVVVCHAAGRIKLLHSLSICPQYCWCWCCDCWCSRRRCCRPPDVLRGWWWVLNPARSAGPCIQHRLGQHQGAPWTRPQRQPRCCRARTGGVSAGCARPPPKSRQRPRCLGSCSAQVASLTGKPELVNDSTCTSWPLAGLWGFQPLCCCSLV